MAKTEISALLDKIKSHITFANGTIDKKLSRKGKREFTGETFIELRIQSNLSETDFRKNVAKLMPQFGGKHDKDFSYAPTSSKCSSQSYNFKIGKVTYPVLITYGLGERAKALRAEKSVIDSMKSLIAGEDISNDKHFNRVVAIVESLERNLHIKINSQTVDEIIKGCGGTNRWLKQSHEMGECIADVIIKMKNGLVIPVSLKDADGDFIFNSGVGRLDGKKNKGKIGSSFKPLPETRLARAFEMLGITDEMIHAYANGMKSYVVKRQCEKVSFDIDRQIEEDSPAFKFMQLAFGEDYYYVRFYKRETTFEHITADKVRNIYLKNLRFLKVEMPYYLDDKKSNKSMIMVLESDYAKFNILVRDAQGHCVPTNINVAAYPK